MRIIAGTARGRRIETLPGDETRPSSDRVKEALFGILQREVPDALVLDLFSGSGNLALEAISRGAKFAVCNDERRDCTTVIANNAQTLNMRDRISISQMDFRRCLAAQAEKNQRFDLIFLDPPYASDLAMQSLFLIAEMKLLADEGIAIVERDKRSLWHPEKLDALGLRLASDRRYGSTTLSFLRPITGE